ncbi:hypothetical protein RJ641_027470 [Dillenia turbinata]|uniref:50S ribosomal protein 5, chloroplastic n=1 Tax=Dillenia turbinata TaxID=194707 RepID=A0AAN8ZPN9_9MAGN
MDLVTLGPLSAISSSSRLCATIAVAFVPPTPAVSTMHRKPMFLHQNPFNGFPLPSVIKATQGRDSRMIIVKASSEIGDPSPGPESGDTSSEDEEESIPIQNLPLESKLQLKLEQKLKMKLDKKIRLRRKRLVRKRRMRKKGRWPPSKMKKNQNV